jgi:hypothetical protein
MPSVAACSRFRIRWGWLVVVPLALLSLSFRPRPASGAEIGVGVGLAGVSLDGAGIGIQIRARRNESRWYFGWEYANSYPYTYSDPNNGRPLTETSEFATGPFAHYRFRRGTRSSWYLGASLLEWSRTETSLVFGDRVTETSIDPYVGGGFVGTLTKHFLFNGALLLAPWAHMEYATSGSSFETDGNLNIQLMLVSVF